MSDLFPGPSVDDIRDIDIRRELRREIRVRRTIYPRWVEQGKLDQATADQRILVLEAALLRFNQPGEHHAQD